MMAEELQAKSRARAEAARSTREGVDAARALPTRLGSEGLDHDTGPSGEEARRSRTRRGSRQRTQGEMMKGRCQNPG